MFHKDRTIGRFSKAIVWTLASCGAPLDKIRGTETNLRKEPMTSDKIVSVSLF